MGTRYRQRRSTARGPPGRPRRLWGVLDNLRLDWLRDGSLPAYGAKPTIAPDGTIHLTRGRRQATIPAS